MRLDEIGGDWWRLDEGDERIQAYTVGTGKGTGRPREERGVPCGSYVQIVDASLVQTGDGSGRPRTSVVLSIRYTG